MIQSNEHSIREANADILITGLNRDKTRTTHGPVLPVSVDSVVADREYQIYFELSGTPSQGWRDIFEREWMAMTQPPLWQKASIDNRFLIMCCPLQDIAATHLPVLNKVVAATNAAYHHYAQKMAEEQVHRTEVWSHERKAVDEMAESLHFG